jgi:hypothetical protein
MDDWSLNGFELMKMCIVAEYEQFCTTTPSSSPQTPSTASNITSTTAVVKHCVDAVKTLAENIADIGGKQRGLTQAGCMPGQSVAVRIKSLIQERLPHIALIDE